MPLSRRLQDICAVKNKVSYKIRKLRESKDLKQKHVADELNITESAYSKIERGITDPSIGRLDQIAKILGVTVSYFFQEPAPLKMEEEHAVYGFATRNDVDAINNAIRQLKQEIAALKKDMAFIHGHTTKRKK
jgi:transcriptional regulator with XRE-family HTH domain